MAHVQRGSRLVVLVLALGFGVALIALVPGTPAFGLDLPPQNGEYVSAAAAERELIGRWRVVAGYDTEQPEFSKLVPPTETPWLEFRPDYNGTDATGPVEGERFTWEIAEAERELWISMHYPDYEDTVTLKLVFHNGRMIVIRPDFDRSSGNPTINAVVYERLAGAQ